MVSKNEIKLVKQLEQKKYRNRFKLFVAEGPKVVGDLLRCGFQPNIIYATSEFVGGSTSLDLSARTNKITPVTEDELRRLSFLQHPQQVLAIFPIPEPTLPSSTSGLCLALDGVQDPGNLGTIIRIADWFGIENIYCSLDTADAWSPKVIQATMGSIARVNMFYTDLIELLHHTTLPVYGTLLDGNDIYAQQLSSEGIIVMGNEGNGISAEVRSLVSHRLLIPNYRKGDTAESLNVAIATAITCAEFRRRLS